MALFAISYFSNAIKRALACAGTDVKAIGFCSTGASFVSSFVSSSACIDVPPATITGGFFKIDLAGITAICYLAFCGLFCGLFLG
jgi:hypothetical protein